MTALPHPSDHRLVGAARAWHDELGRLADAPLWSLSTGEAEDVLLELTRARAQLDGLLLRVLRRAEGLEAGLASGATSTPSWWSHATRTTRAEAHRFSRLARSLERHPLVGDRLASGDLLTDQAGAIVEAVEALPDHAEPWVPEAATAHLLRAAEEHDAKALRVLGRRLLEVVDPAAADAEEARRLEAEERDARAAASLTLRDDGHGRCHGRFTVPTLHGEMLRKHLSALASPSRALARDTTSVGRPLSAHRMGTAFVEYVETRPADSLPSTGGVPATVVVTMQLDTLVGGLGAASLDTGPRISAGEARRLACRAGIIPAVLGGPSVVLDLGRRRRLHTESQRIALALRDGGCTAEGCDAPPGRCQAHHDVPWSAGGGTSVARGRLLCPAHHRRLHDPAFQHSLDKHGKVRFTRRT